MLISMRGVKGFEGSANLESSSGGIEYFHLLMIMRGLG